MKRILSLVLILALIPACFAVPALADDNVSSWVDILQYGFANGTASNKVDLPSAYSGSYFYTYYNVPASARIYYIDMYVICNDPALTVSRNPTSNYYTCERVTGDLYHVYGWGNFFSGAVTMYWHYTTGTYATVVSLRGSLVQTETYSISSVTGSGAAYGVHDIPIIISGVNTAATWEYTDYDNFYSYYGAFSVNFDVSGWQNYDYVDIELSFLVDGISTISAYIGGVSVPCEVSTVIDNQSYSTMYLVNVRMDVSGFNPATDTGDLTLTVRGNSLTPASSDADSSTNILTLRRCIGHIAIPEPSLLAYWFTQLRGWFSDQTSGITGAIASWGQAIVDSIGGSNNDSSQLKDDLNNSLGQLGEAGAVMDSVERPDIGKINLDVSGMVSAYGMTAAASVVSLFTDNAVFGPMILMYFTLALASFVIFGRG